MYKKYLTLSNPYTLLGLQRANFANKKNVPEIACKPSMYKTFQYRIKDRANAAKLANVSKSVNFVWNYCNELSYEEWRRSRKWISKYDLQKLTKGSAKELGINSATLQLVIHEHDKKRKQFKRSKLKWRSKKRSLPWIPFDTRCFHIKGDWIRAGNIRLKIWKHRELEGVIKTASITQNAKGNWFVNITCECPDVKPVATKKIVGIDLGFRETAVCSDGKIYDSPKPLRKYQEKLAKAQRAKKKRQVTNIHEKIKNIRKDFNHKATTEIVKNNDTIFVGNVSSKAMLKRGKGFAKSASDASWGQFRTMLAYKANRLGKVFQPVNEAWSTVTCSVCNARSGPSGLSAIGVRNWVCDRCGTEHSRDQNAAINIRNFGAGLSAPIQEAPEFIRGE